MTDLDAREGGLPAAEPSPVFRRGTRSYVLRSGRVSAAQQRAYDTWAPRYCVPFSAAPLDFPALFGNFHPLTVEIGFGMGSATARIAQENPDQNYLGIEVHRPGIGRLLWEIEKRSLANIRIVEHDAVETLQQMLGAGSVAAFHIFFPDPWPKKRHHKRRLITRPFTDLLAEKLRSGAYIYMVTDAEDYARWAVAELSATAQLRNPYAAAAGGCAPPQPWRPRTEFEAKGLAQGHGIWELYFVKDT
ncbi:MAG: tRNA (guanosine(46)-N7)-methyltransferase TrmB [Treponema sp.]|jgi:tRNA (guanine-N7-)-methyltransferase|nr:tRNA (guanosine(46)-N7)-methyltransferase TrmB [Treponema sp.]